MELRSPTTNQAFPHDRPLQNTMPLDGEEDYIIKCICNYDDDDGNTVECDQCKTWQHIDCYYNGVQPPGEHSVHYCTDCEPRALDAKAAAERQRLRGNTLRFPSTLPNDRRVRKTGQPKSSKRRLRVGQSEDEHNPETTTNRSFEVDPRFQTPGDIDLQHSGGRKPKLGSRSHEGSKLRTTSVSEAKYSDLNVRDRNDSPSDLQHGHAPPPLSVNTKSFSEEFIHLYDNDPGVVPMEGNLLSDIKIAEKLALWCRDDGAVKEVTQGKLRSDIFSNDTEGLSLPEPWPVHVAEVMRTVDGTKTVHMKCIIVESNHKIPKLTPVGELRGKIGHMTDYAEDPVNRWKFLCHPLPFVFFHPQLPIYIDTRREGNLFRYLRRSCSPNLAMRTVVRNSSDYHFCLVTTQELEPGAELTLPWTLDEHARALLTNRSIRSPERQQDTDDQRYIGPYSRKLLANFGGCACHDESKCPMIRWAFPNEQNHLHRSQQLHRSKSKKRLRSDLFLRKVSSHGQPDDDGSPRSSAASSGQLRSRSQTPSARNETDELPRLPLDSMISGREMRKIAALEKVYLREPGRYNDSRRWGKSTGPAESRTEQGERLYNAESLQHVKPDPDHLDSVFSPITHDRDHDQIVDPLDHETNYCDRSTQTSRCNRSNKQISVIFHGVKPTLNLMRKQKSLWLNARLLSRDSASKSGLPEIQDRTQFALSAPDYIVEPTETHERLCRADNVVDTMVIDSVQEIKPADLQEDLENDSRDIDRSPEQVDSQFKTEEFNAPTRAIHMSPIKKKMSLGDYMSRRTHQVSGKG